MKYLNAQKMIILKNKEEFYFKVIIKIIKEQKK